MSDRSIFEIIDKGMKEHLEMAGNRTGGLLSKEKIYQNYGKDFYREIGKKGGVKAKTDPETGKQLKGFAVSGLASVAGAKGGVISKRGKAKK